MDKLIVVETPPLDLEADGSGGYQQSSGLLTGYSLFIGGSTLGWVHESKIDLSGYVMQDMTTYFRQSFEQTGGFRSVQWQATTSKPLIAFAGSYLEMTLVSTVPLTNDNLLAATTIAPGFTPMADASITFGNFNREHIIHGRLCIYGIDSTLGADAFDDDGAGYNRIVQEYDFSSLEPVAVDTLFVYRLLLFSASATLPTPGALSVVNIPPKRIILDATMDKESDIPYLMRLKRGYELANQV